MATIKPTFSTIAVGRGNGSCMVVKWTPVTEADTCAPVSFPEYSDKSIQVYGTFGSASIALNGSNDTVDNASPTFAALRDPSSTTIAITSAGIKAVLENTVQVQPVSSGGSSSSVTIIVMFHVANPLRA